MVFWWQNCVAAWDVGLLLEERWLSPDEIGDCHKSKWLLQYRIDLYWSKQTCPQTTSGKSPPQHPGQAKTARKSTPTPAQPVPPIPQVQACNPPQLPCYYVRQRTQSRAYAFPFCTIERLRTSSLDFVCFRHRSSSALFTLRDVTTNFSHVALVLYRLD